MRHLLLLFILPGWAMAQSWQPLHQNKDYLFRLSDDTIQQVINVRPDAWYGDSVLHLNRVVAYDSATNYYNQFMPCLLGNELYEHNGAYTFDGNNRICIKPTEALNTAWLYDTSQNISAQITQLSSISVFSMPDSVITISLSSGDSILLSKRYGLLSFPLGNGMYVNAVGVRDTTCHGECIPNAIEMMDFSMGDVFMYKATDFSYEPAPSTTTHTVIEYRKRYINTKAPFADSVIYDSHVLQRTEYYTNSTFNYFTETSFDETFKVERNSGDFLSATPFTPVQMNFANNFGWPYGEFSYLGTTTYGFRVIDVTKTDSGQYQKVNGPLYCLPGDTFVQYNNSSGNKKEYISGLGLTYYYSDAFENTGWHEVKQLGYIHNGIAHGIVMDDIEVVTGMQEGAANKVSVYPMPAFDLLHISSAEDFDVRLFDLNGMELLKGTFKPNGVLAVHELASGHYFLRFTNKNSSFTRPVVITH